MARQLENNFRTNLCKKLKIQHAEHIFIQKLHGGFYQAGLPDTIFVFEGPTSFVEFKADENRWFELDNITKMQMHTLRNIALAGGLAGVWHWNVSQRKLQVFTYASLVAGTWEQDSRYYEPELLIQNSSLLKEALWQTQ